MEIPGLISPVVPGTGGFHNFGAVVPFGNHVLEIPTIDEKLKFNFPGKRENPRGRNNKSL